MHIPNLFRAIPEQLNPAQTPASPPELAAARTLRHRFQQPQDAEYGLFDMVRAFRLLRGKRSYVEVGSRDKGGVAMAEVAMGPGANIVEIDIEETPRESAILKEVLSPSTRFLSIVGDCLKADTVRQVSAAIGPAGADVIFCDTVHFYGHALAEFDAYFPLVRSGGLMMIHDCYYQGNGTLKGKSQAFSEIDRLVPVYAIYGNEPLHRFLPRDRIDQPYWAGFAIIIKP